MCRHHSAPTTSKAWQVWECRESAKVLNFKKWRKLRLRLALFREWKAHEDDAPKQNSLQTQFKQQAPKAYLTNEQAMKYKDKSLKNTNCTQFGVRGLDVIIFLQHLRAVCMGARYEYTL